MTGIERGSPACPEVHDLEAHDPHGWPLANALRTHTTQHVRELGVHFDLTGCGPYEAPPHEATVHPIGIAGREMAILVAGISVRRPFDEDCRAFHQMVATAIAAAESNARSLETEHSRAEGLAEIDRAKTAFFSNVSHEFRTPLTLMLGPIEDCFASPDALPPKVDANLRTVHRNSLRLLKLVNSLLDFSRIEAGRMQASFEATDLPALTGELASMFRAAVESAGLRLFVDCLPLDTPVHVDREMWEKIVLNLLSNAFKHTFEGEVGVRVRRVGDRAELVVHDTGTGIAPESLPHVFDRFYRVPGAASRTHEGTGIGLALVQDLVRQHGGSIEVASELGVGTTFTLSVPLGTAHLPADRVRTLASRATTTQVATPFVEEALRWLPDAPSTDNRAIDTAACNASQDRGCRRERIVLADDNADMRDYVRGLLADRYEVEVVGDGEAALAALHRSPADLLITDVMMPRLDGIELLTAIRKVPALASLPVVMLSARAGEEAKIEGIAQGADDYLVKPFSARELCTRVRTHMDLARLRRHWATELERANKELEAFSYSVSHDLRTPLRSIDGFSIALLEDCGDDLPEVGRGHLRRVRAAAQRMSELIDDLLQLSHVARMGFCSETTDLGSLARAVLADLQRREPERQVDVHIAEGLQVQGDHGLLKIALENLLGNAWKFTGKRPSAKIELGTRTGPSGVEYFVRDNGAGFDMQYVDRLFRPFQRLHAATDYPGTGIGLATVQRIIGRHGGDVVAEGALDQGATFSFTLGRTGGALP